MVDGVSEIAELAENVKQLTAAVQEMAGTRLSRAQVMDRLRIKSSKTLAEYVRHRHFPCDVAGYWLLSSVIEWERSKAAGR